METELKTSNFTGKIKELSDDIINKIAAGEVIENPASAVKEMIENAIDAHAKRIRIQIEEGGKKLIKISDDGDGMETDDLSVCYLRHTTSKLKSAEDLFRLRTNGFRGEAIASIAAISEMTITTRTENSSEGHALKIIGNKPERITTVSSKKGTTFLVENLFFNTPVRKNFLKSTAYEGTKILDTVMRLAIAHPEIRFEYYVGEKEVFLGASEDLRGRIAETIGSGIARKMIDVHYEENGICVTGFISPLDETFKVRGNQYFYLQNRPIWNALINKAVTQSYDPYGKGHPVCVLFLSLLDADFDVNVHPAKREVRFADENKVFLAVRHAVKQALQNDSLKNAPGPVIDFSTIVNTTNDNENEESSVSITAFDYPKNNFSKEEPTDFLAEAKVNYNTNATTSNETFGLDNVTKTSENASNLYSVKNSNSTKNVTPESLLSRDLFDTEAKGIVLHIPQEKAEEASFTPPLFLQIAKTYIACEDAEGLLIIDQNAAHTRILYEQAMRNLECKTQMDAQELLFPELMEFTKLESTLILQSANTLERLGFALEHFGGESFQLRTIPAKLPLKRAISAVRDMLNTISDEYPTEKDPVKEAFAKSYAKSCAIRAGDSLQSSEMAQILTQLFLTEEPFVSPFGRPTILRLTSKELESKFKR